MTRRAPATARRARSASGQSLSGSAPSSTRRSRWPSAAARSVASASWSASAGARPSRQRADHVAAPQRRQHGGAGAPVEHGLQRSDGGLGRLGEVRTAGDHDDVAARDLLGDVGVGERLGDRCLLRAGFVAQRLPGVRRHAGLERRELDDPRALLLGGVTQAQVQHGQLFLEVRPEQDDGGGGRRLVDGGPVEPENLGGQAVAELRVAVRDADRVGELRPRERVLVGAAGAAEQADAAGSAVDERLGDERCRSA